MSWEDLPCKGNCSPLQYSYLENSMNSGAWQATVHGVAKSQTQLGDFTSKCYTPYDSKSGKLSNCHTTGKGQFSFQSQRRAMPKNVQTTTQLHSFHMLKILQARLQQYMNKELPDVQYGFRKVRGTRDQIADICWIMEKAREFHKNIYFCYIDTAKL